MSGRLSWRTVEYAFLIEMFYKGKWEAEIGTRRYAHALEIAQVYPAGRTKVRIIRCYDGEVLWKNY